MLMPASSLKAGAGYNIITVKAVSRVQITIAGILKAGRLMPYRGGV